jgi:uncharacterized membrane protein (DUF4010 family)
MEQTFLAGILSPFLQGLIVATCIGFIIGLEREFSTRDEKSHLGGIRTFPLVCIFSYTIGVLSKFNTVHLISAALIGFCALTAVSYFTQTEKGKLGLTNQLALLVTFALGILAASGQYINALATATIVAAVLSLKEEIHSFVRQINDEEMKAFIVFFLLALVMLPLLPDQNFGPENLLNGRSIGWIVVIVSSISFAGYLLLKFYGLGRGILLMAVVGGLYSSTMVAWVFSAKSKELPNASARYAAGAVLSSSIMFLRVLFLVSIFNQALVVHLAIPCLILAIVSAVCVLYIYKQDTGDTSETQLPLGNPLDLKNVLFFIGLYIGISYFTHYSRTWFGNTGAYTSGAISGIADIDAITISTANWSKEPARQLDAAKIILIAMMANSIFKGGMSMIRGSEVFRKWVFLGFAAIIAIGLTMLLIL